MQRPAPLRFVTHSLSLIGTLIVGVFAGLIAAFGGTKSVVIVPGLAAMLGFVLLPFSGLYAIVATTPINVEIVGPITVSRLAILMGAVAIYVQVIRQQIEKPRLTIWPEGSLVTLFFAWVLIATLAAGGGGYVTKLGPWLIFAILFFTVLNYAQDQTRIHRLFVIIGVVGILQAALVLAEAFFGFSPFGGWHETLAEDQGEAEVRVVGTSSHPILLAGFFQVVVGSIVTLILLRGEAVWRLFWIVCLGAIFLGWWFTFSRSSWIGMGAMTFVGMWLAHPLTRKLALIGGIVGFTILAAFNFEPSAIIRFIESFGSIQKASVTSGVAAGSDSFSWRTENWSAAWNLFLKHPLFGTGIDASKALMIANLPRGAIAHQYIVPEVPHNMFLLILAELGLISFLLFVAICLMSLKAGLRAMQHASLRPYAIALLAIMAGQLATFFFNPIPREVWLTMALTMALGRVARITEETAYAAKAKAPAPRPLQPLTAKAPCRRAPRRSRAVSAR